MIKESLSNVNYDNVYWLFHSEWLSRKDRGNRLNMSVYIYVSQSIYICIQNYDIRIVSWDCAIKFCFCLLMYNVYDPCGSTGGQSSVFKEEKKL